MALSIKPAPQTSRLHRLISWQLILQLLRQLLLLMSSSCHPSLSTPEVPNRSLSLMPCAPNRTATRRYNLGADRAVSSCNRISRLTDRLLMALCGVVLALLTVVAAALRDSAEDLSGVRPLRVLVRPTPAFSHWNIHSSISQELVKRGHTVAYMYSDEEEDMPIKLGLPRNSSFAFKHPFPLQQILVSGLQVHASHGAGLCPHTSSDQQCLWPRRLTVPNVCQLEQVSMPA